MPNEIGKSEQPSPDDVLAAIQSFNDPNIILNIFKECGWTYSFEIKQTIELAKQKANVSIQFKAIKHLRELLREAAETAGYTANVSQTMPNAQGGHTTFHAKRIAKMLNPTKQIKSNVKESENDKTEKIQTNNEKDELRRGSDRRQSQDAGANSTDPKRDTGRASPSGDADVRGAEPPDGGEITGHPSSDRGRVLTADCGNLENPKESNPCIKTQPPSAGSGNLFPGISSGDD